MTDSCYQRRAAAYERLLAEVLAPEGMAEPPTDPPRLSELAVQELWDAGLLGDEGDTCGHGHLRILDRGTWNRGAGPDFVGAEIELDGRRLRGDIEIDPCARDWEHHGHGANVNYNRVVLHIVLEEPPPGWFTRNEQHCEVAVWHLPPESLCSAAGLHAPPDRDLTGLCHTPLAAASPGSVRALLEAAAAHRISQKRKRFYRKADQLGAEQAWFEAWAEALGYSENKLAMVALARRAPLKHLRKDAEAILLGTAGFLIPMLPDSATHEARAYHRSIWDSWWVQQERFALDTGRAISWNFAGQRPLNHPQRRVAALALSACIWAQITPRLTVSGARSAEKLLRGIEHDFWDFHCTLNSRKLPRRTSLIGAERVRDFMVNSVYPLDDSPGVWDAYLALKDSHSLPTGVQHTAARLFGPREDLHALLRYHYVRQGLLQIQADFCTHSVCGECLFPTQLKQWCCE